MDNNDATKDMSVGVKTICASATAACWRVLIMPLDTLKTTMQVSGKKGGHKLTHKLQVSGPRVLYNGAIAASAANFVGHYPWFFTFNYLSANLPPFTISTDYPELNKFARMATIGFFASFMSDTCSNSIRVVKTTKQTFEKHITYPEVVKHIIKSDGVLGLFGRGLKTKIFANGVQGMMFSVAWKFTQTKFM